MKKRLQSPWEYLFFGLTPEDRENVILEPGWICLYYLGLSWIESYNMPISYTGINDEHAAVRNSIGIFDVSHMGEFILKGEHALDLIQRITSNDASKLSNGKAQYS